MSFFPLRRRLMLGSAIATAGLVSLSPAMASEILRGNDAADVVAEAAADVSDVTRLEPVIVTGSREAARLAGGSAVYLDGEQLDIHAYGDVNRVLRQVPGVYLQEEDGFGLRPNIGIRGSGTDRSSRVAIMEDGVLMAPAPYAAPASYYFPRLARISGVEVVKGPGAIQYGPLTTGGTVQLFSTPLAESLSGRFDLMAGSYGGFRGYGVMGGWFAPSELSLGGWQIGAQIEWLDERSDGFKALDSGGDTGFRIDDLVLKLGLRSGPDARFPQSLELKYQTYDERSDETYLGLTLADFSASPYRRYRGSQIDRMDVGHETWQLTHRIALNAALELTTIAYRNETARAWYKLNDVRNSANTGWLGISAVLANPGANPAQMSYLIGAPGFTSPANALRVRNNSRAYLAEGVQSALTARFDTGPASHTLTASVRWHRDSEDRFQQDDIYQMADGIMRLTSAGAPGSQENRVVSAEAWAFFVRDEIRLGALTLTPGVRYETIDLTQTRYTLGDASRAVPTGVDENSVDVWIPGLGATYDVNARLRLVGGVHRGFSNPAPGSSAAPETSWNYEAGARWQDGPFNAELIAFYTDYDNLVGTCTASTGGGCAIGDQFDGGAVRVRGIEAMAGYDLALTPGLSVPLSLVYTYTDAEFRTSFVSNYGPWGTVMAGDTLPYTPSHQLTFNAGLRADGWRLDASVNHVSEARARAGSGPVADAQRIDARTLLDLSGEVRVSDQVALFASAQNVTDEVYNVAFSPAGARPGAPRMIMGGLRLRF